MLSSALLFSFSIPFLRKLVSETVSSQEFLYLAYLMPPWSSLTSSCQLKTLGKWFCLMCGALDTNLPCSPTLKCKWHEFFISLFERAFKMMKNGVYFIVIVLLVGMLFKMTYDVTLWRQNDVKSQKMEYPWRLFCIELKLCTVVALTTKFHDITTDISMATQWAPGPLHSKDKIRVFSFKKCYLLLLLLQWVWANMDITQHKHKKLR